MAAEVGDEVKVGPRVRSDIDEGGGPNIRARAIDQAGLGGSSAYVGTVHALEPAARALVPRVADGRVSPVPALADDLRAGVQVVDYYYPVLIQVVDSHQAVRAEMGLVVAVHGAGWVTGLFVEQEQIGVYCFHTGMNRGEERFRRPGLMDAPAQAIVLLFRHSEVARCVRPGAQLCVAGGHHLAAVLIDDAPPAGSPKFEVNLPAAGPAQVAQGWVAGFLFAHRPVFSLPPQVEQPAAFDGEKVFGQGEYAFVDGGQQLVAVVVHQAHALTDLHQPQAARVFL